MAFDRLVSDTLDVLDRPEVVTALAASALELGVVEEIRSAVSGAFLPNVRHGRASAPQQYQGMDNLALLPVSEHEARSGIAVDPSMFQITPRRRESLKEALHAKFPEWGETLVARGTQILSLDALEWIRGRPLMPQLSLSTTGRCVAEIYHSGPDSLNVTVRPNLLVRPDALGSGRRAYGRTVAGAAILGHEVLHAIDYEAQHPAAVSPDDESFGAYTEARAYHFTDCVMSAAGVTKEPIAAEKIRRRYNTDPATPFAAPAALIAEYKTAGVM